MVIVLKSFYCTYCRCAETGSSLQYSDRWRVEPCSHTGRKPSNIHRRYDTAHQLCLAALKQRQENRHDTLRQLCPTALKLARKRYERNLVLKLPLASSYSCTCIIKGKARTQSPTIINYAPELPTFGVIAGVSPTEVQWKGLTLGEPPS